MKERNATLKAVKAAALMLMFAFTWSAVVAQETPDDLVVAPTAPPPPQLTEAEQKARAAEIMVLQSKVDDCNVTFMGLPVEHEACIQEVISLMESDAPAGDTVKVDEAID